ncbi:efflux RND transporter periplasmic adaptor subunit [Thiohalomonas denitrificans]|uniref:HlyD family secretion protein n=1 Tax=Thiohalomonas denitrificans TaxID=415747 RepID=A0A1G5Q1W4_9GAMM|nr:efflux RND transporter periplasmic adaptor subunit [Thiohalomonas denitrificans]SCZ55608.1 HlyD family secretion protein [Thiohalomonas denitrificans]
MRKALLIALIGIAVVVAAIYLWPGTDDGEGPGERLTIYGNVDIREVTVAFKGSERIATLNVEEGDRVQAGQLLGSLETLRLEHALERAHARMVAQQAQLAALKAGTRPEEIRRARAEVEAAQARAVNARRTYSRLQNLLEQKLASEEDVDEAKASRDAANAQLRAARESLQLAEKGPREEDIAAARATLKSLEAEVALAELDLAEASLESPVGGVIRDRILEAGEMASPQRPVYTVAIDSPLWVRAYLPEPQLGHVRIGMGAWVISDSFPGKRYRAWVGYISPTAQFTPKSVQTEEVRTRLVYQVRIIVCNPEGELRLGMPAEVQIPLSGNTPRGPHECGKSR